MLFTSTAHSDSGELFYFQWSAFMLLSVFLPFNNEEKTLAEVVDRIEQGTHKAGYNLELILVDDGSTDGSGMEAKRLADGRDDVKLIQHRINLGLTVATQRAIHECNGDFFLRMEADLESHPDEDIPKLMQKIEEGYDVVCGRRVGRADGKYFLSVIYNTVSNRLFHMALHDMNWIKVIRKDCLPELELRSDWHRFIPQILHAKGFKVTEVDTHWYPREHGTTHFGWTRIPIAFFDAIAVKFILSFTKAPFRFFGFAGALQVLLAVAIVICMLLGKVLGRYAFHARPMLYFVVILFLSGVIFFFMGFLAELIVSVRDEVKSLKKK